MPARSAPSGRLQATKQEETMKGSLTCVFTDSVEDMSKELVSEELQFCPILFPFGYVEDQLNTMTSSWADFPATGDSDNVGYDQFRTRSSIESCGAYYV